MIHCLLLGFLALSQAGSSKGSLELQNIQAVHGIVFPERRPCVYYNQADFILFRFDVLGLQIPKGKLSNVDVEMTLTDQKGQLAHFSRFTNDVDYWGMNSSVRCFAFMDIPRVTLPGEYVFIANVKDPVSRQSASFERKITIKSPEFAIKQVLLRTGKESEHGGFTTMPVGLNLACELQIWSDRSMKERNNLPLLLTFEFVDRLTSTSVYSGELPLNVTNAQASDFIFARFTTGILRQKGHFNVHITVKDVEASRSLSYEFPLSVVDP